MARLLKTIIIFAAIMAATAAFSSCKNENTSDNPSVPRPDIKVTEITEAEQEHIAPQEEPPEAPQAQTIYNSYVVNMEINPAQRKVQAIEKISYKNQTGEELGKIFLKFNINSFSKEYKEEPFFDEFKNKVYKYGKDFSDFSISAVTINSENVPYEIIGRNVGINLAKPLSPEGSIEITLQLEGTLPKICHRTGANNDAMWFGNFIPLVASYIDGEFALDQYYPAGDPFVNEISKFDLSITTPKEYSVYGTGLEKITETDAYITTRLTTNMARDMAFALSNKFIEDTITTESGVAINFYHYTKDLNADKILEAAAKSAEFLSKNVGTYPYQEIDIVETELFIQGGMEFPGIVFLDSSYLKTTSDFESVAHEIAHQWFYNVVGSNQIKDAWMDEGLTYYLQAYLTSSEDEVDNKMTALYETVSKSLSAADNYMLTDDLSVYKSWSEYTNVHYLRGSLLFHALYNKMGSEKFYEFLKAYFNENSFKIASKKGMIDCASMVYGDSLDDFFESWMTWRELPNLPAGD